jgi:serine protease Do
VCGVVVSRSEFYPKPAKPPAHAGQLGDYNPAAFLKDNPGKANLAAHLDLSNTRNAPAHTTTGGVLVDASGLVLTTYQPLDGATRIYVHLPGGKGSYADIHAADSRCDLAVLKLQNPPAGLKPIKFGNVTVSVPNATVQPGKMVVLLSNPVSTGFRFDKPSGGLGVISNVRKRLGSPLVKQEATSRSAYAYASMLEHDAKLHADGSGLPLVNFDGELIGLTTLGHTLTGAEYGPGFAFPMDANMKRIVEVLMRGEEVEYGYFGITTASNPFNPGAEPPLKVSSVAPHSPAWASGLSPDDTIRTINGVPVTGYGDLLFFGGSALAGATLKLGCTDRAGGVKNVELKLGKFKHDEPFIASVRPDPVFGLTVDYGSILAQKLFNRQRGVDRGPGVPPGVCVRDVVADSPAAKKFKTLGDDPRQWLITHVNGEHVTTPAEFLAAAKGKDSVKLTLIDPTAAVRPRELTLP